MVADWEKHGNSGENGIENYPFLPVSVFKEYALRSTEGEVMALRSSATTSGVASQIFVDRATKKRQTMSANKILADFVGPQRRPYLVFDVEQTVRGTEAMSARGAAIMSLAHLASDFYFVLREEQGELVLDRKALTEALAAIDGQPFVAYGFTYMLYQIHQQMIDESYAVPAAHPDSVLLHSGGWKRMIDMAVDKPSMNQTVAGVWGLAPDRVIDFYGAIEQVGMLYPDCADGYKHVPYWADVIMRDRDSLAPVAVGQTGLMQLVNCLPKSAPNHSVLTEDLGSIVMTDGCACGRRGKAFVFKGRAPRSEVRGCSDVAGR